MMAEMPVIAGDPAQERAATEGTTAAHTHAPRPEKDSTSKYDPLTAGEMAQAVLAARLCLTGLVRDFLRSLSEPLTVLDPDPATALAKASRHLENRLLAPPVETDPFHVLVRGFRLSPLESDLLLLALWPHLDERLGEVQRSWTGSSGPLRVRDVIGALIPGNGSRSTAVAHLASSQLWEGGVFRVVDPALSVFDRPLIPSPVVVARWNGAWPNILETGAEVRLYPPQSGIEALLRDCPRYGGALEAGAHLLKGDAACLLRLEIATAGGDPEDAAIEAAACLAAVLHCRLFVVVHREGALSRTFRETEVLAVLTSALPLVIHTPTRDDSTTVIAFEPSGPFLWSSFSTSLRIETGRATARRWTIPRLRADERAAIWRRLVAEAGGAADCDVLGLQVGLDFRAMNLAVAEARRMAQVQAASHPSVDQVQGTSVPAGPGTAFSHSHLAAALRQLRPTDIASLGNTRWPSKELKDLVLDRETRASLQKVATRLKHRVEVEVRWGLGGGSEAIPGLTVLLHGESGTGKTLSAEALAKSVSLPLLSADLSQVVSKYIGETEKQIEQLLRTAEGFRAVLFFDEADALFGKRTSVQDSHDRYANIEVNYLLQRLERFEGLVILATNLLQNLDNAFLRRIHLTVHFARPNPVLRRRLWQIHLPAGRLAEGIDLDAISRRYDLVGGDIRNAASDAAYRAAAEGGMITREHLQAALQEEFRKKGRPLPVP